MKSTRTFWLCACAGLLLPAASARAEQIIWSEQIVVTPSVVWGQAESGPTPPGRGGIRLKGDAHWHKVVGTTDLVAASLRSFTEGHPDTVYHFQDAPYSVTLLIRDKQSGLFGAVTFTGEFGGTLSKHSAQITNTWTSATSAALHLGHHVYDVSLDAFAPPGIPGSRPSSLGVHVTVHDNPEPPALVLAGLALPALVLAGRYRRPKARGA